MRKQPTVHSPLGAFGNFTFPNWTQRVHIRDAQSERSADRQLVAEDPHPPRRVTRATVRTEWGEACDSFLAPSAGKNLRNQTRAPARVGAAHA